ncbi:hypothetical protein Tco_1481000, partial [Tanacetum coccineum]
MRVGQPTPSSTPLGNAVVGCSNLCSYLGQISNLVRGPRSEISIIS